MEDADGDGAGDRGGRRFLFEVQTKNGKLPEEAGRWPRQRRGPEHLLMRILPLLRTTRSKLIVSFLGVSFLVGAVSLVVGGHLLYRTFMGEAINRVRQDLNAARHMYEDRCRRVELALAVTTLGRGFREALQPERSRELAERLARVAEWAGLDFAGVADTRGRAMVRLRGESVPEEAVRCAPNPLAELSLKTNGVVSGTLVLSEAWLRCEDPVLAERARIQLVPMPPAASGEDATLTSGMALVGAVPIREEGAVIGVLYGGVLLNRSTEIVDTVRNTVFKNERYRGREIGTATIFFKDIRIATNVLAENGARALGTRVSPEVAERVLGKGLNWDDRAFVVNDWYLTAYEPIEDVFGERVGMLYVGVLEQPYADVRRKALTVFTVLSLLGITLAVGLGWFLEKKIMRPIHLLTDAAGAVSRGNLSPDLGSISESEVGVLQKTFESMLASIRERESRQREESASILALAQRQASVGRLAAGVAHEINNPLTGVLAFSHMLLDRHDLDEEARESLQMIAEATERVRRIVRGLLDFSRQTDIDPQETAIEGLVRSTLTLVENQALVKGVELQVEAAADLPLVTVDPGQIRSVLVNLVINALDATDPGGRIRVSVRSVPAASEGEGRGSGVEIAVSDTGVGIAPENIEKIFDPFYTTKEIGKGTGLGLSVSYGIVARHGGKITVESEVGRGSTFRVWLPAHRREEA